MGQTVLVVDDEVEIADLVELYLKNEGFAVRKFYNGHDALECVRTEELDLAILDVMLPDIDGFTQDPAAALHALQPGRRRRAEAAGG